MKNTEIKKILLEASYSGKKKQWYLNGTAISGDEIENITKTRKRNKRKNRRRALLVGFPKYIANQNIREKFLLHTLRKRNFQSERTWETIRKIQGKIIPCD